MTTPNTFLAVFLGSKTSPRMAAWTALPEGERRSKEQEGMAAWKAWMEKHQAAIVGMAGCMKGLQTGSDAGAVGRSATSAVVLGITLIIVANAVIDWLAALLQI